MNQNKLQTKLTNIFERYKNNTNIELLIIADFDRTLSTGNSAECHGFMSNFIVNLMKRKHHYNQF